MPSVERIALMLSGHEEVVRPASRRVRALAERAGVEVVDDGTAAGATEPTEERMPRPRPAGGGDRPDLAVVLGGDGTMLRALQRFLDDQVPVVGVNFGRVGFLTAITPDELEPGLERVFAGDYRVVRLPTLEVAFDGETHVAVNDAVVTSGTIGRIIELGYAIGDEDLGLQRCDGLVCSTPQGSTAYNLSNGGPVLVWGLDAMVLTFVAPHSLHIRPLVVPRGQEVTVTNRSEGVPTTVIVDGHPIGSLQAGEAARVRVGERQSLLGTLPENTFFTRYAATFGR